MTRREWLAKNPPPGTSGALVDQAEKLEADVATQVSQLKAQAAAYPIYAGQCNAQVQQLLAPAQELRRQAAASPGKCPTHPQAALHRHMNRIEDLFVCQQGPHFLLWTNYGGRPQFVHIDVSKELPGLDSEMT